MHRPETNGARSPGPRGPLACATTAAARLAREWITSRIGKPSRSAWFLCGGQAGEGPNVSHNRRRSTTTAKPTRKTHRRGPRHRCGRIAIARQPRSARKTRHLRLERAWSTESNRTRSPSRQLGRCTARDKPQSPRRAAAAKATEPCAGSGPSPGRASASRRAAASCFGAARGGGRRPLRGHRSCRPWPRPGAVAKAGLPPPGFAGVTTGRRTPVLSGSDPTLRPLPHPDPVPGAGRWRPAPRPRSGGRQPAVPVRRPGSAAGAAPARRSGWRPSNPSRAAARIRPREGGTPAQTAAACRRSCRSAGGLRKPIPSHRLALQCAHGAAAQAVRERWAGAGGRSAAGVQVPK